MEREKQYLYTIEDLNTAFDMGLESAVFILEKSINLSRMGQRHLFEGMKEKTIEGRVASVKASRSIIPIC